MGGNTMISNITLVRHGETNYRESDSPPDEFDPFSPHFSLTVDHLDLTEKGIEECNDTGTQLVEFLKETNERALLISSPSWRAQSSMFVIEHKLRENNIPIINSPRVLLLSDDLRSITIRRDLESEKRKQLRADWKSQHSAYKRLHPEALSFLPKKLHTLVAKEMGQTILDIFEEDHDSVDKRLRKFLRYHLSEKFLETLSGTQATQRVRIIATTHEEVLSIFAEEVLHIKRTLANGQILEIAIHPNGSTEYVRATMTLHVKSNDSDSESGSIDVNMSDLLHYGK